MSLPAVLDSVYIFVVSLNSKSVTMYLAVLLSMVSSAV